MSIIRYENHIISFIIFVLILYKFFCHGFFIMWLKFDNAIFTEKKLLFFKKGGSLEVVSANLLP